MSNSNNLKIWKSPYLKKKSGVHIVVDYAEDTRFSNFAIEYLCKNEKLHETVYACSFGAQIESFKPKKYDRKSRDAVPLMCWKTFISFFYYCSTSSYCYSPVRNVFNFSVPFLSWLAFTVLLVVTIILYFIPTRWGSYTVQSDSVTRIVCEIRRQRDGSSKFLSYTFLGGGGGWGFFWGGGGNLCQNSLH